MSTVLVTGGSGFLGSHCIIRLLAAGHRVRTTLRSLDRETDVRLMLAAGGAESGYALSFFAADLEKDAGWPEAIAGCDYVLHVASPLPGRAPKDENELIVPARDGALRVLRTARAAGVQRVVLTSSFAAIGYSRQMQGDPFTEEDWTDPDMPNPPYIRSKTIAERAAWGFIANEGGELELSVINPVGIFGPVLGKDYAASIAIVKRMLDGDMPGLPEIYIGVVDVRDVADLHIRAMTHPAANGERFIAAAGEAMSMRDVAHLLRSRLGETASHVPRMQLANWQVRLVALFSAAARQTAANLGKRRNASSEKSRRVLGWSPRSSEEALLATAKSLIRFGLLKRRQAA